MNIVLVFIKQTQIIYCNMRKSLIMEKLLLLDLKKSINNKKDSTNINYNSYIQLFKIAVHFEQVSVIFNNIKNNFIMLEYFKIIHTPTHSVFLHSNIS